MQVIKVKFTLVLSACTGPTHHLNPI